MNIFDVIILLLIGAVLCAALLCGKKKKGCCGTCADCAGCAAKPDASIRDRNDPAKGQEGL